MNERNPAMQGKLSDSNDSLRKKWRKYEKLENDNNKITITSKLEK